MELHFSFSDHRTFNMLYCRHTCHRTISHATFFILLQHFSRDIFCSFIKSQLRNPVAPSLWGASSATLAKAVQPLPSAVTYWRQIGRRFPYCLRRAATCLVNSRRIRYGSLQISPAAISEPFEVQMAVGRRDSCSGRSGGASPRWQLVITRRDTAPESCFRVSLIWWAGFYRRSERRLWRGLFRRDR